MRLHLLSLPHTQTTEQYLSCAYTQKVVKFCKMMTALDHEVILYAGEQNEAECTEHVQLISEKERAGWFGDGFDTVLTPLLWDANEPYWKTMNQRAIPEIRKRADKQDLLLAIAGWCQHPVAQALEPMLTVEWGVGYEGIFANYCAFESYAWMHHVYGKRAEQTRGAMGINGRWYDEVIPNFFDPDDFPVGNGKKDYLLFIGRLVERKGPHVAAQVAERLGMKLIVAGPGATSWGPGRVTAPEITLKGDIEYVGEVGKEDRAVLMREARAVLAPTIYIEPFGGVAVEAMMAGTPAVTSDWGAFTETVEPGVTGERFRTLGEGAVATIKAMELSPDSVRARAVERYSLEAVGPQFQTWFERVNGLWGKGWDA